MADELDLLTERTQALRAQGMDGRAAFRVAWFELQLRTWPRDWGNTLHFVLFGDLQPPATDLILPELRITIRKENVEGSVIRGAFCVLKAEAALDELTVDALTGAARRINAFIGVSDLVQWGRGPRGWWSRFTHPIEGASGHLATDDVPRALATLLVLDPQVRRKVDAALYWMREPVALMMEGYRSDVLRVYAGCWNAFECLVEAVEILRPMAKVKPAEKQAKLNALIGERGEGLKVKDVENFFREVVDVGFPARAKHALSVCFPQDAERYFRECFTLEHRQNRLYQVRNDIAHGNVDTSDLLELARIEGHCRDWRR